MPFIDRKDAGEQLGRALQGYRADNPVIVALPRGGVPVAAGICRALDAPLELLIVRKIGVPGRPELAMGAVVDGGSPVTLRNEGVIEMAGVTEADFAAVRDRELAEIMRRRQRYLTREEPGRSIQGRTLILVDDGVATGATIRVAIRALRLRNPSRIVVAVPVGPPDIPATLRSEADAVICLETPDNFQAIGQFYRDFSQVEDSQVLQILDAARGSSRQE
jgi:putative phosphoribosyl transferase